LSKLFITIGSLLDIKKQSRQIASITIRLAKCNKSRKETKNKKFFWIVGFGIAVFAIAMGIQ